MTESASAHGKPPGPPPREELPDRVLVHPLPKAIVLYPTAILCVVFGLIAMWYPAGQEPKLLGLSFVALFGLNLCCFPERVPSEALTG